MIYALSYWDVFTIIYGLAIVGFVATASFFAVKKIKKILAKKQIYNKSKIAVEKIDEKSALNEYHTVKNYEKIYNKKYQTLKKFKNVFAKDTELANYSKKDYHNSKLNRVKEKMLKTVGINIEEVTPDYVLNNQNNIDRRTYIQIFNEQDANEFSQFAEQNLPTTFNEKPIVVECNFAKDYNHKPLIVSATNKDTFEFGVSLIGEKIEKYYQKDGDKIFPITLNQQPGNLVQELKDYQDIKNNQTEQEQTL